MTTGGLSSIPEPGFLPEEGVELDSLSEDGSMAAAAMAAARKAGQRGSELQVQVNAGQVSGEEQQGLGSPQGSLLQESPRQGSLLQESPRDEEEEGFFKRAGRRLRLSIYGRDQRESYYRDSLIGPDLAMAIRSKRSTQTNTRRFRLGWHRRLVPYHWQEKICDVIDSLSWNLFILALAILAVFAPDIVVLCSAPDSVNTWINSFLIASMVIFGAETALNFLCRPSLLFLRLALDIISNLSLLFAITWFTEAVGARTDGTTSDAARACRILRLVRVVSVLEILGWRAKQRYARNNPAAAAALADQMAPTNIGKKIGEIATLQVATVVISAVVCTSLILGADLSTGSNEELQGFVDSLAAMADAGATAQQLQPTIDAMLAFSVNVLDSKEAPMVLDVMGVGSWDWVQQQGGWTARSTDREVLTRGGVSLQVNVAGANHQSARLSMALAGAVVALLLLFVVLLNLTIWKMLVQPLDRIFYSIRTNAAQVVAALGTPEEEGGGGAGGGGGSGGRGSKKDDPLDIITIEAAVTKMGRILEQYTSTGGVGLNAVKKMASNADQSTKEWLATMVAGPGSEEVVTGRRSSGGTSLLGRAPRSPPQPRLSPVPGQGQSAGLPLRMAYGRPGGGMQRRSRLGRMSEIQIVAAAQAQAQGQGQGLGPGSLLHTISDADRQHSREREQIRRSSLAQFQQRTSGMEHGGSTQLGGTPLGSTYGSGGSSTQLGSTHQEAARGSGGGGGGGGGGLQRQAASPQGQPPAVAASAAAIAAAATATASSASPPTSPAAGGTAAIVAGTTIPSGTSTALVPAGTGEPRPGSAELRTPLVAASSTASSDAAALAISAVRQPGWHAAPSEAWAQLHSSSLSEAEKKLLGQVDVDYLHSFSFDALGIPATLLPAYACAMFLELDLAFFSGADAALIDDPAPVGRAGFVDVATLWRFVNEVAATYHKVPYHNFQHCVDVTHTTFMFIKRVAHKVALTELEKFALMVAALCHDLDHPGVNNAFLVNAQDPLATTYNDSSVLENRHVACLYGLLLSKPHLNVFAHLDPAQWKEVRKMVIGAVLATDMVHHFPMVSKLEVFYELHAASIQAHHRALRQGLPRDNLPRLFDAAEERQLLLNLLLHCADISNPVKPATIAEKWADRVLAEFFAQGDRERAAGLAISPMCDREKTSRAGSQINFIEFVVAPIYAQVYKIFPELGEVLDNLMANRHFWQDALAAELAGAELAGPGGGTGGTGGSVHGGTGGSTMARTPEQRAEEEAKAEKRLRDFQDKYRDILSKRRQQLVRLASAQSGSLSFFSPAQPGSPGGGGRHGSLMALVEGGTDGTAPDTADRQRSGTAALTSSLFGKLLRPGIIGRSSSRGTTMAHYGGTGGSRRSSNASLENGGEVAPRTASATAAALAASGGGGGGGGHGSSGPGCLGGHGRVVPEDESVV